VLEQQAVCAFALLSEIPTPARLEDQLIQALEGSVIRHYLVPTGTGFARSTDFWCASLDASSAFVE